MSKPVRQQREAHEGPLDPKSLSRLQQLKESRDVIKERLQQIVEDIVSNGGDFSIKVGTLRSVYKNYLLDHVKLKMGVEKFPAANNVKHDYRKLSRYDLTKVLATEGVRDKTDKVLVPPLTKKDLIEARNRGNARTVLNTTNKKLKKQGKQIEQLKAASVASADANMRAVLDRISSLQEECSKLIESCQDMKTKKRARGEESSESEDIDEEIMKHLTAGDDESVAEAVAECAAEQSLQNLQKQLAEEALNAVAKKERKRRKKASE
jgi:hypothetical protein